MLGLFDYVKPNTNYEALARRLRDTVLDSSGQLTPWAARYGAFLLGDHAHTIVGDYVTVANAILRYALIAHLTNNIYPPAARLNNRPRSPIPSTNPPA